MRVGYFAPLPPARSGIADYALSLLGALKQRGDVLIAPSEYDIGLYQIGNSALHAETYQRALRQPGLVVLHDALLQHFFLGTLTEQQYLDEFAYNYGEWSRSEARTLWNERASSGSDTRYFDRPMLRRIAERSHALVVHNPEARQRVLRHAPEARVVEIPHFHVPTQRPDSAEVEAFRGRCRYLFGVFGYLRESKRLFSVLRAFTRLRKLRSDVALLVAGEFHSKDLERALETEWLAPGVRRIGHMSEANFAVAAEAVDCCLNLRYPSAGETSGIGVRLMGLGKPVIFSEGRETASLPEGSYLAVETGLREEAHLFEWICLLSAKPEIGREIGRRAADHILRYHSMKAASEQFWKTLCDLYP